MKQFRQAITKSISWGDKGLRFAILPFLIYAIPQFKEVYDKMVQIDTQWGVMQKFESDVQQLKIDTAVLKELTKCNREATTTNIVLPRSRRQVSEEVAPASAPTTTAIHDPAKLDQYIQQKTYEFGGDTE